MTGNSKKFHLSSILTITTGILLPHPNNPFDYPISMVYDILDFMSGESLMTHALPRVAEEAAPILEQEYPWTKLVKFPGIPEGMKDNPVTIDNFLGQWVDTQIEIYGEYHEVWPMHSDDHHSIDPMNEPILDKLKDDGKIIEINITDEEPPSTTGNINWKVDNDNNDLE